MSHFSPFDIGQIKAHAYHGLSAESIAYMSEHSLAVLVFLRLIRSTLAHVVVVCALAAHPLAGKMLPQPHSTSKSPSLKKSFVFFGGIDIPSEFQD